MEHWEGEHWEGESTERGESIERGEQGALGGRESINWEGERALGGRALGGGSIGREGALGETLFQ